MRIARLAVAALVLPVAAAAQDAPAPDPTGTLLWDALPPGADLVVHAPSVPRFLDSAIEAGFGTRDGWRAAFRRQLAAWTADGADAAALAGAAEELLALADGEAVVAGVELPRLGSATAPRQRCTLVAMRSRAKAGTLRAQVDALIEHGLRARWDGAPSVDRTGGRTTISLPGTFDGLWIGVEDHLVAACDHPAGLPLLVRGIERVAREGRQPEDMTSIPLRVRHGHAESPERWEGLTFLQREAVSSPLRPVAASPSVREGGAVVAWATDAPKDVPLFPVRVPEGVLAGATGLSARPLVARLLPDGTFTVAGGAPTPAGAKPLVGAAARLGWLRALAEGTLPPPIPSLDPAALRIALDAAAAAPPKDAPDVHDWRPTEQDGEVRGPAWHGPLTFLALRTLRDAVHGVPPAARAPEPPPEPEKPGASPPSPPSDPWRPGDPPPKPGPAIPPPDPLPPKRGK